MSKMKLDRLPFVSVIIPLYNDKIRIEKCLDALVQQSYPAAHYEIIVVDNNSTDNYALVVEKFQIKLLQQLDTQSSYAARNKGIQNAAGQILAFTDSDCIPGKDWLIEGVKALEEQDADLASGNVRFIYSLQKTGAEIFDSLTNMQIKQNIADRNVSKTANLFVRAKVFDAIGHFPKVQSGGDVLWTGRATQKGYKLVYNRYAEVSHPARKLWALIKKQYRVGKGQPSIMAGSGNSVIRNLLRILKPILPTRLLSVFRMVKKRQADATTVQAVRASLSGYLCFVSNFFGNLMALPDLWKK